MRKYYNSHYTKKNSRIMLLKIKVLIGNLLSKIPYKYIPFIGTIYERSTLNIYSFENLDVEFKKSYIYNKVYKIVDYAIKNIPFYRNYYHNCGFEISQLKSFADISKIPIIKKELLLNVPLEERSAIVPFRYIANTGGSTGKPLSFYKTKQLKIKELAYFHFIWQNLGYKKSDLRLHFIGRSILDGKLNYNLIENSLQADVYTPFGNVLYTLKRLNTIIRYIHGYPSTIYEFALYCNLHPEEFEQSKLKQSLKGIFFKSEFPHPYYRDIIESVFKVKTFSHYGHTEVCALAYEKEEKNNYYILHSYGFVENKKFENGNHLIVTSYDNFASPLIRYDTEDVINNEIYDKNLLQWFYIKEGRSTDYIIDKNGKKISLTGIIFGKHHELFNYCSQMQVEQKKKGSAIIYYVPKGALPLDFNANKYFNSSNIKIDFEFKKIESPIMTSSGKVMLLIRGN